MGILHINGLGAEKNYTKALKYFEIAASANQTEALNGLAFLYLHGHGVTQNRKKAYDLFKKAALLGNPEAQTNVAAVLMKGYPEINPNISEAYEFLKMAVKKDHPTSFLYLGTLLSSARFYKQLNITVNDNPCGSAVEYLLKGAHKGSFVKEILNIASKLIHLKDFESAYFMYAFAGSLGISEGLYAAAFLWEHNFIKNYKCGLGNNKACAFYYYMLAYIMGDTKSAIKMGDILYYDGKLDEAAKLYSISIERDQDPQAIFNMGYCYQFGKGVNSSQKEAFDLYDKLIEGAKSESFEFEVIFPALIMKGVAFAKRIASHLPIINSYVSYDN